MLVPHERRDVLAARVLPPVVDEHPRPLALPGVRREHLAVARLARALAHVQLAGVEVVVGVDPALARVEEGGVEGVAVPVGLDLALPGLRALRLVRVRHVPGEDRAGPHPAHPPGVPERLAVGEDGAVAAVEVVPAVAVEVPAEPAHPVVVLGGDGQLQEAHSVPEQSDTWKKRNKERLAGGKYSLERALFPTFHCACV